MHPTKLEAQRARVARKYVPAWQKDALMLPLGKLPEATVPRSSPDTALNAFAQLVALRLDVERALIHIIDGQYQYILAESTRTLSSQSDDVHEAHDGLLFGNSTILKAHGLCEILLQREADVGNPRHSSPEPLVSFDIHGEPAFSDHHFTTVHPDIKFYASVPLQLEGSFTIGSICTFDRHPRTTISNGLTRFLIDMAKTVSRHLITIKSASKYHQVQGLFQSLDTFMKRPSPQAAHTDQVTAAMRQDSGEVFATKQQDADPANPPRGTTDPPQTTPPISQGSSNSEEPPSLAAPAQFQSPVVPTETAQMFQEASVLLRKGFQATGVSIIDGSSGAVDDSKDLRGAPMTEADPSSSASGEPDDGSETLTGNGRPDTKPAYCRVIASDPTNQHHPESGIQISERDMKLILRAYPSGQVFHSEGSHDVSSSSDADLVGSGALGDSDPSSFVTVDSEPSARGRRSVKAPLSRLAAQMNGAQRFAIFPLWDHQRDRWYAAGIIWTNETDQRSLDYEDLRFLKAFGLCIMAEVARMDALTDREQKSTFLSMISHELRTPLHGIFANVEILEADGNEQLQATAIQTVLTCSHMLLDILNHLLDHNTLRKQSEHFRRRKSKILSPHTQATIASPENAMRSNPVEVSETSDIASVSENLVRMMANADRHHSTSAKPMIGAGRSSKISQEYLSQNVSTVSQLTGPLVQLEVEYHHNWSIHVPVGAYERILMNLLGNSLKYTEKGKITISLTRRKVAAKPAVCGIFLSITDTGQGISAEYLSQSLYTAWKQENTNATGSGLGLSVVSRIVSDLNGEVDVRSEKGIGTRVTVQFPAKLAPHSQRNQRQSRSQPSMKGHFYLPEAVRPPAAPHKPSEEADPSKLTGLLQNVTSLLSDWYNCGLVPRTMSKIADADFIILDQLCFGDMSEESLMTQVNQLYARAIAGQDHVPVILLAGDAIFLKRLHSYVQADATHVTFCSRPYGPVGLRDMVCATRDKDSVRQTGQSLMASATTGDPPQSPNSDDNMPFRTKGAPGEEPGRLGRTEISEERSSQSDAIATSDSGVEGEDNGFALLVEDNTLNMKILELYAKRIKLPYAKAANGREAVDLFEADPLKYSMVWMDVNMPVMDGITATRHIRSIERHSPRSQPSLILALTGLGSDEDRRRALVNGVDEFHTKPVSFKVLSQAYEAWTQKSKSQTPP